MSKEHITFDQGGPGSLFDALDNSKKSTESLKDSVIDDKINNLEKEETLTDPKEIFDALKENTTIEGPLVPAGAEWTLQKTGDYIVLVQSVNGTQPFWLTDIIKIDYTALEEENNNTTQLTVAVNGSPITLLLTLEGTEVTVVAQAAEADQEPVETVDGSYAVPVFIKKVEEAVEEAVEEELDNDDETADPTKEVTTLDPDVKLISGEGIPFLGQFYNKYRTTLLDTNGNKVDINTYQLLYRLTKSLDIMDVDRIHEKRVISLDLSVLKDGNQHDIKDPEGNERPVYLQEENGILTGVVDADFIKTLIKKNEEEKKAKRAERKQKREDIVDDIKQKTNEVLDSLTQQYDKLLLWSPEASAYVIAQSKEQYENLIAGFKEAYEKTRANLNKRVYEENGVETITLSDYSLITSYDEELKPLGETYTADLAPFSVEQGNEDYNYNIVKKECTYNPDGSIKSEEKFHIATITKDSQSLSITGSELNKMQQVRLGESIDITVENEQTGKNEVWKFKPFVEDNNDGSFTLNMAAELPESQKIAPAKLMTPEYIDIGFEWPIEEGSRGISSPFGRRESTASDHKGVDFLARDKTLSSVADGKVYLVGNDPDGWGQYIAIQHENAGKKYLTIYAHLKNNSITVEAGQAVSAGQHIATTGDTGSKGKYHLHMEVMVPDPKNTSGVPGRRPVNPMQYLPSNVSNTQTVPSTPTNFPPQAPEVIPSVSAGKLTIEIDVFRDFKMDLDEPIEFSINSENGKVIENVNYLSTKLKNKEDNFTLSKKYRLAYDEAVGGLVIADKQKNIKVVVSDYLDKFTYTNEDVGDWTLKSDTTQVTIDGTGYTLGLYVKGKRIRVQLY